MFTWAEFTAEVISRLGIDSINPNAELQEQFDKSTLDCAVDLQRYVKALREGHQTTFTPGEGRRVYPKGTEFTLPSGIRKVDQFYYREAFQAGDDAERCESWPVGFTITGFAVVAAMNGTYERTGIVDPLEKIDELGYGPLWFVNTSDETYGIRIVKKGETYHPAFFVESDPIEDGELYYLGNPLTEDDEGNLAYSPWLNEDLPDAMVVEGNSQAQVYPKKAFEVGGKPSYGRDIGTIITIQYNIYWQDLFGEGLGWKIANYNLSPSEFDYSYSFEDVATPDQVSSWTYTDGDNPTVRRATWADIDAAGIDRSTVPLYSDPYWRDSSDDTTEILPDLVENRIKLRTPRPLNFVPWDEIESCGDSLSWSSPRPGLAPFVFRGPFKSRYDTIELYWTGVKRVFADGDATPFTTECARAAALYVKAETSLGHKEKRIQSREYQRRYEEERRAIFLDYKDMTDSLQ